MAETRETPIPEIKQSKEIKKSVPKEPGLLSFLGKILGKMSEKEEQDYIDKHGINPRARDAEWRKLTGGIFGSESSSRRKRLEELEKDKKR